MKLSSKIMQLYWKNTILSEKRKEDLYYFIKGIVGGNINRSNKGDIDRIYIKELLEKQLLSNSFSVNFPKYNKFCLTDRDPKLLAYYLPQYYPDSHNDIWWGKGSTEWTNITKAFPQYIGHYQPRLPGELGYYDLRIQDNIYRQIELAETFGVYGFCFYYYWFDGERILDLPVDNYVKDESIKFPFCISWINTSWTKQWSGTSMTPLIEVPKNKNSYKKFIKDCLCLFSKENYIRINNKPILIIYKPLEIPEREEVIDHWRGVVKKELGTDLYLIGSFNDPYIINNQQTVNGFDAISEFAPGPHWEFMKNIASEKEYVCDNFTGKVYDYKEFVENKKYFKIRAHKLYRAISPMWDNTARKRNKGIILDGATPELYKQWLIDIIRETNNNMILDDNIVFINAWNEWAEGTYLEPDLNWKYGYLEATRQAILDSRILQ